MSGGFSESMDNLAALDKQILVERHLISPNMPPRARAAGWS
jgi:protein-arginine kinase